MNKIDQLSSNKKDLAKELLKSTISMMPFAGPIFATLIYEIIPNQRIDRISNYLKELDHKLSSLPHEIIEKLLKNEEFIDLLEESFLIASRSLTVERRQYIASIVAKGITNEDIKLHESKHILKLLHELNDIEIIWLKYYYVQNTDEEASFKENHCLVLTPINRYSRVNGYELKEAVIKNSYIDHLHRLNLMAEEKRQSKPLSSSPNYDRELGYTHTNRSRITALGQMLLYEIGLIGVNN